MENNLELRLNALYFIMYGSMACFHPFIAVYFDSRGLNYIQIGAAFALLSLVGIFAQPIWGFITDKYLNKKKTLLITMLLCSVLIFSFVLSQSFSFVMLSILLLLIFQSPIMSICDAYCYDILEENRHLQFGKIRLVGSIGFALVSLGLGKVIELTYIDVSFFFYAAFLLTSAAIVMGIRHEGRQNIKRAKLADLLNVLKNYKFFFFIVSIMVLCIANGANSSYIAILIGKTGGNVTNLGLLWFLQAMSELPFFYFGNRVIKKYGELNILITALFLYAVRFLLSSFCTSYVEVMLVQLMQGITFPLFLTAALQYVNRIVPNQIRASGITLLSSLGFGLGSFLGNLGGGYVLQVSTIFHLYQLLSFVSVLSLTVALFLKVKSFRTAV